MFSSKNSSSSNHTRTNRSRKDDRGGREQRGKQSCDQSRKLEIM